MSSAEIEVLTDSLRSELSRMNNELAHWERSKESSLTNLSDTFLLELEEAENTIEALKLNHERLDSIYQQNMELRRDQEDELNEMQTSIHNFKRQERELIPQLQAAQREERKKQQELNSAEQAYEERREFLERGERELTEGVFLYKWLGLDFVKTEDDCLRFSFRYLGDEDEDEDEDPFFTLNITEEGSYQLTALFVPGKGYGDADATLMRHSRVQTLLAELNRENNFSLFVVEMRKFLREQMSQ
jgi:hypothetical protein